MRGEHIDVTAELERLKDEILRRPVGARVAAAVPSRSVVPAPAVSPAGGAEPRDAGNSDQDNRPPRPGADRPSAPKVEPSHPARPTIHPQTVEVVDEPADAARLRKALIELRFRVLELNSESTSHRYGRVRYRVRFGPGVRLSHLKARAADLGRAMRSLRIPTIDNVPGDDRIAIEFRVEANDTPSLWPLLEQLPAPGPGALPILLGVDVDGSPIILDLASAPHLLIAGTSGSGKTTLVHQILASLVSRFAASDLELLLVDPKGTDLAMFQGISHLGGGKIVFEARDAVEAIVDVVEQTFETRTRVLAESGLGSVAELNRTSGRTSVRPIVIVVEELADLVDALDNREEREKFLRALVRIGQRARSIGIHLILVTQRPSAEILPPRLKANLPIRVCLQVPQLGDSLIVLDRPGAEMLGGKGDFLFRHDGQIRRGQGLYASRAELKELLARMKEPSI
jgi:DNA segregation ATPase FtsK/SpoIIIE-like protein